MKTNNLHRRNLTKTQINCAVTAQLISVLVFATRIVQSVFLSNPNFQASSLLLCRTWWKPKLFVLACTSSSNKTMECNQTSKNSFLNVHVGRTFFFVLLKTYIAFIICYYHLSFVIIFEVIFMKIKRELHDVSIRLPWYKCSLQIE